MFYYENDVDNETDNRVSFCLINTMIDYFVFIRINLLRYIGVCWMEMWLLEICATFFLLNVCFLKLSLHIFHHFIYVFCSSFFSLITKQSVVVVRSFCLLDKFFVVLNGAYLRFNTCRSYELWTHPNGTTNEINSI